MHNSTQSASQYYLDITRIIEWRARRHCVALQCSETLAGLMMLARIGPEGLLTEDEFSSLSPETRSVNEMLLHSD